MGAERFSKEVMQLAVLLLTIGVLGQTAFGGGWTVQKQAEMTNVEKRTFRISKTGNDVVRAWFILGGELREAFSGKLPVYRVDGNRVRNLSEYQSGFVTDREKSRWISWVLSRSVVNYSDELQEIIVGSEIVFQYYMPDGAIYETTFSLEGAKEAIEEVLGN